MTDLIFVIFGSTGDLTARKILPAITNLAQSNLISKNLKILALGRRDFDTAEFLEYADDLTTAELDFRFLKDKLTYLQMQITQSSDYQKLKEAIKTIAGPNTKMMFYLAIGPELLPVVAKNLSLAHLIHKGSKQQTLVFEKPFGHDLISAKAINQMLFKYFDESQIYRIDHYLGKEMIQNIMTIRFANRIFDALWNKDNIAYIKIVAKEVDGILNRGSYYDNAGAIRDMVQSHLLQMLALVTMESPKLDNPQSIKDAKVNILSNLSIKANDIILGQYDTYLQEANVKPNSTTETAVFMKLSVNSERFKGVPIYIFTGKQLNKKYTYIEITFKPTPSQCDWQMDLTDVNKILFRVDPENDVQIVINSKPIGIDHDTEKVRLSLNQDDLHIPEAYEKLLFDITNGNSTLFPRWDEIESAWHFVDTMKLNNQKLIKYHDLNDLVEIIKVKYNIKL